MENYFLIKKYIFHKLGGIFSLIVDEFTLLPFLSALDLLLLFILKVWDFVCLRAFDLKPKGISRSKLFILFRMSGFFSSRPNRTLLYSLYVSNTVLCSLYAPQDTDVSPFKQ